MQPSRETLNQAAGILPSQGCAEPGLLKAMSAHRSTLQGKVSPLFTRRLTGFQWLRECCLSLKKPFHDSLVGE